MIPTSTDVTFEISGKPTAKAPAVAVLVPEGAKDAGSSASMLTEEQQGAVSRLLSAGVATGKLREVRFDLLNLGAKSYAHVLVAGVGKQEKVTPENIRQAVGALVRA